MNSFYVWLKLEYITTFYKFYNVKEFHILII